jgi:hypothetical protein
VDPIRVRRNKNKTYLECRFIAPEQKAAKQMLASIEMSNAPKGQRSVRDILNIMHNMPSTVKDIGISSRTAEAVRTAKLAAWKVILQDWRDVVPHTTSWTADGTCVVSSQPTLAAGVEGRSGSVKEWEFQR